MTVRTRPTINEKFYLILGNVWGVGGLVSKDGFMLAVAALYMAMALAIIVIDYLADINDSKNQQPN